MALAQTVVYTIVASFFMGKMVLVQIARLSFFPSIFRQRHREESHKQSVGFPRHRYMQQHHAAPARGESELMLAI